MAYSQVVTCGGEAAVRVCAGIVKCSGGSIGELLDGIELANTDWRELLVAAEFAEDARAHQGWLRSFAVD